MAIYSNSPGPMQGGGAKAGTKPACTAQYYPSQGGELSAQSMGYEADGAVGEKEGMPSPMGSFMSDDGNHDIRPQQTFASMHGLPAVSLTPENTEGSIISGDPTAAEGSTGPIEYPHQGPPPGTTSVGGGPGQAPEY